MYKIIHFPKIINMLGSNKDMVSMPSFGCTDSLIAVILFSSKSLYLNQLCFHPQTLNCFCIPLCTKGITLAFSILTYKTGKSNCGVNSWKYFHENCYIGIFTGTWFCKNNLMIWWTALHALGYQIWIKYPNSLY